MVEAASPSDVPVGYWPREAILADIPELGDAWVPLLSALVLHGLVDEIESGGATTRRRRSYSVTPFGRKVLERLAVG